MSMSFFTSGQLGEFKAILDSTRDIPGVYLSSVRVMLQRPEVVRQLFWTEGTNPSKQTPQAAGKESASLSFEVRRRITMLGLFELLLKGEYAAFTKEQKKPLSLAAFQQLSEEANLLNANELAAIRASCFFVISDSAREQLKKVTSQDVFDSEVFLTRVTEALLKCDKEQRGSLMPYSALLTESQFTLLSQCYLENCHLRHMMFTEGGKNMFKGLEQAEPSAIKLWKWRWLCNLFGFNGNSTYYDQDVHDIVAELFKKIKATKNPHQLLVEYLCWRADRAGFLQRSGSDIDENEKLFLGHLAAFGNKVTILDVESGQEILRGYLYFRDQLHGGLTPAADYVQYFIPNVQVTPTYIPALMNAVYDILSNVKDQEFQSLQQKMSPLFDGKKLSPLSLATIYCCQVLAAIYRPAVSYRERVSCQKSTSKAVLLELLKGWLENGLALSASVINNEVFVSGVQARSENQPRPR
ncbi:MAG: hypothetical protein A2103_01495 [Gammaproteobacteria bacterium GWF2_41_13]|nr:MAG: hypothetical protein A2103_01495 [Gammaproteobacteria bacterium GWF2_41_13]